MQPNPYSEKMFYRIRTLTREKKMSPRFRPKRHSITRLPLPNACSLIAFEHTISTFCGKVLLFHHLPLLPRFKFILYSQFLGVLLFILHNNIHINSQNETKPQAKRAKNSIDAVPATSVPQSASLVIIFARLND